MRPIACFKFVSVRFFLAPSDIGTEFQVPCVLAVASSSQALTVCGQSFQWSVLLPVNMQGAGRQ